MRHDTSFGQALRVARKRAGLSQPELGRLIGTTGMHVSDVECGRKAPFIHEQVLRAAALLNVPPAVLLGQWARWHQQVPLHQTGDERRDLIAAALSAAWAALNPASLERIAREVGL